MKIRLLLTILLLTATIAANTQIMERTFLKKVLTKLEKIESATYYVTDESRQPDDSTTLFSSKEFELIAIESWSRQVSSIRNYANRKKLNDTILNAANEVIKQYQTSGATPYFFIYFLRRMGFQLVPILLGIVLGPLAEKNFRRAMVISEGSFSIFFTRPISCAFILIAIVSVAIFGIRNYKSRKLAKQNTAETSPDRL